MAEGQGKAGEIKGELAEIIAHPSYADENHPKHKLAVELAEKSLSNRQRKRSFTNPAFRE